MPRTLDHTAGVFRALHESHVGRAPAPRDFRAADFPARAIEQARRTWQKRFQTEYRSAQVLARFVTEVLGAGDPLEVYAGAVDMVMDEVRHAHLCAAVCDALGVPAQLPEPLELRDPERFLRAPMPDRALTTAITLLAINETLSARIIRDLRDRCAQPFVRAVLDATVADEDGHEAYGWAYVTASLARFPARTLPDWRRLATESVAAHDEASRADLAAVPEELRTLGAHPEPERVALGMIGRERRALLVRDTLEAVVKPRLRALGLWGDAGT